MMASLSRTYQDTNDTHGLIAQTRFGQPRRRPTITAYEKNQRYGKGDFAGSHAPIDTQIHWSWSNPLNIVPALLILLMLVALVSMLFA